MAGWKGIVGQSFTPDAFDSYCQTLHWTAWRPSFIVLHNTAIPSLAQRPAGITLAHIQNFVSYYRDVEGWNSGPHLFIDDKQIWVFTPLIVSGTHSPSWNQVSLGIEMLGDYEHEAFESGRGLLVRQNAVAALATLSAVLGIEAQTLHLHREDPLTTHATCPGKNVDKGAMIQAVQALLAARHPGEHTLASKDLTLAATEIDATAAATASGAPETPISPVASVPPDSDPPSPVA